MTTDRILSELDIEQSSDAFKAHMISRIMATADLRFARIIDDIMTDEDRHEFEVFSKDKEPQDVARWVEEKYEGIGQFYDGIIKEIVADLKRKGEQAYEG